MPGILTQTRSPGERAIRVWVYQRWTPRNDRACYTRGLAAIKQSIEALPMDDKAQLLEAVMTPQMRLRILVNQVRRRGDEGADRHVDRVVNRAVKRVRRAAGTR